MPSLARKSVPRYNHAEILKQHKSALLPILRDAEKMPLKCTGSPVTDVAFPSPRHKGKFGIFLRGKDSLTMVIDAPVSSNDFVGCSLIQPSIILEGPQSNKSAMLGVPSELTVLEMHLFHVLLGSITVLSTVSQII